MGLPTGLSVDTPEERQAVLTVRSAKDILGEITALSQILGGGKAALGDRVSAKRALFEASERLCNLMSLAQNQVDHHISGDLQQALMRDLNALRDRLLGMGTKLMVEKLRRIGQRVEAVLRDGSYPLGLSGKLTLSYSELIGNLQILGGDQRLSAEDRAAIEGTRERLRQLEEIEHGLGLMTDVGRSAGGDRRARLRAAKPVAPQANSDATLGETLPDVGP